MITPRFEATQDDKYVYLKIHASLARVKDTEIYMQETLFKFYSKPYYLRLHLPGEVEENNDASAHYDAHTGCYNVQVPKVNPGEHFEGLDMLTSLLTPKKLKEGPLIEVLDSHKESDEDGDDGNEEPEWFIEQHLPEEPDNVLGGFGYGFANKTSGLFNDLKSEVEEAFDIRDPDRVSFSERRNRAFEREKIDFSEDHYLADAFGPEGLQWIKQLLKFSPPWQVEHVVEWTDEEKEKMVNLPKKEYLLESKELIQVEFGLVNVLYAYAFNHRLTEGENTVESAWTVAKLSSMLSWFERFKSVQDVCRRCVRRALIYPLYRSWDLAVKVLQDTAELLLLGRRGILRCLLEIYGMFAKSECYYILNRLYIQDYCVWIQQVEDESHLKTLGEVLKKFVPTKDMVELELVELDHAAKLVKEEEEARMEAITNKMKQLATEDARDSDDSSSSDSSSSSSDSSDSDDSWDSDDSDSEASYHPNNVEGQKALNSDL